MRRCCLFLVASMLATGVSHAADISGLGWGEFVAEDASSAKPAEVDAKVASRTMTMSMAVENFNATLETGQTDASASFTGSFLVTQPSKLALGSLRATVSGLIVKTPGTTVRIDLNIGGVTKTLEWADQETKSERFTAELAGALPGGRLPSPLPVSAIALVKRMQKDATALVTIDSINMEIGEALIGSAKPLPQQAKPATHEASPARFAQSGNSGLDGDRLQ